MGDVGVGDSGLVGAEEAEVCSGMAVWRSRRIGGWSTHRDVVVVMGEIVFAVAVAVADWIVCAVDGWKAFELPVSRAVS